MADKAEVLIPADPEGMNDERAEWARAAVETFQQETGLSDDDGLDTAILDLLGDLAHLCDREGLQLGELLVRASFHYNEETSSSLAENIVPEVEDRDDCQGPDGTQFDFLPGAAPRCATCGQTYTGDSCLLCEALAIARKERGE